MLKRLFLLAQPIHLFLAGLAFLLGAGMARYLGATLRWPSFWLGILAVLALQFAAALLATYFRMPFQPLTEGETPRLREQFRVRVLQVSFAALTVSGVLVTLLLSTAALSPAAALLLFLAALLLLACALPPLRLAETGYGELAQAIFLATLLPAFSFLLQRGEFHRLLPLVTFPLTLQAVAWLLAAGFPVFASDQKLGRRSLLIRLGWQRAVPVHHALILAAFLLFAAAPSFGVSWGLLWPVFLALPFAAFQIYWLQRIASGGAPVWKLFNVLAPTVFGLTLYLLTFSFWLR